MSAEPDPRCPTCPAWARTSLAVVPERRTVEVEGTAVAYLDWGCAGGPGVVLIHGGAAHARWWSHLAPLLTDHHHVVAIDLSGHGDSGPRDVYDAEVWAREVLAVAEHAGITDPPVLVGHSMGGFVAITAAARYGDRLAGAIIVDSPVRREDPESQEGRGGRMFRAPKTYPDLETALDHFHLVPPQPDPEPWILEHIARSSLREVDGGWTWKFDPAIFVHRSGPTSPEDFGEDLAKVRCRVAVVHGEHSDIVDDDVVDHMSERLGRTAPFVEIAAAHHHLILDQPLAFLAALRALLADWEHSTPRAIPGLRT